MFDSISIKTSTSSNPLDLGYLAESLLFYDRTNLFVNADSLQILLRSVGEGVINELVKRGLLAVYATTSGVLGAADHSHNGVVKLSVDIYSALNVDKHQQMIYESCLSAYGSRGKSRRTANRLVELIHPHRYGEGLVDSIRGTLLDPAFTRSVVASVLAEMGILQEFHGKQWSYDFFPLPDGYLTFSSDLELEKLSAMAGQVGGAFNFSPLSLILSVAEAMGDMEISAGHSSELLTNPFYSLIMENRLDSAFTAAQLKREQIDQLQRYALPKYRDLAGVINSGEKTFSDLLFLLDKAEDFRAWKREIQDEADFVQHYQEAVQDGSWLSTTPAKIGRFVVFNAAAIAAGLAMPFLPAAAAALGLGAFDTFLMERLGTNWKPNRFINGDYKKFVGRK